MCIQRSYNLVPTYIPTVLFEFGYFIWLKAINQYVPLQIQPISRVQNEETLLSLTANASNVTPSCKLTWYFAKTEDLDSLATCTEPGCQVGY